MSRSPEGLSDAFVLVGDANGILAAIAVCRSSYSATPLEHRRVERTREEFAEAYQYRGGRRILTAYSTYPSCLRASIASFESSYPDAPEWSSMPAAVRNGSIRASKNFTRSFLYRI